MIKAAFFDIDGTLVSLKTKVYPPSAKAAIARLRENGVLCFVASGRSKFELRTEKLVDGIEFDGYLTNNGQYAFDPAGNVLYGKPIDPADAAAVLDWAEKKGCACWIVTAEDSILNFVDENVRQAMDAIHTAPPPIGDLRAALRVPIYKIVLFVTREEMAEPNALAVHTRSTQWFPLGHDIIARDGGKKAAMLEILARLNLRPEESIAFGDSENDLEMLQTAGIGVAMGNATEEAKAAADYVTDDCDDDGLWNALKHFGLI